MKYVQGCHTNVYLEREMWQCTHHTTWGDETVHLASYSVSSERPFTEHEGVGAFWIGNDPESTSRSYERGNERVDIRSEDHLVDILTERFPFEPIPQEEIDLVTNRLKQMVEALDERTT